MGAFYLSPASARNLLCENQETYFFVSLMAADTEIIVFGSVGNFGDF